jgi:anti-sigma28 factor (negative regulator of flagellin synthesis)
MKINDTKLTQTELPRLAADTSAIKESAPEKAALAAGPAASIKIANPTVLANAQVLAASGNLSDDKLLDKIRDRIATGTFEIDYGRLAQTMLTEAIAVTGNKGSDANA